MIQVFRCGNLMHAMQESGFFEVGFPTVHVSRIPDDSDDRYHPHPPPRFRLGSGSGSNVPSEVIGDICS